MFSLPLEYICSFSASGDGEGGIEMTGSMQRIREFCDLVISPAKATRTRIVCVKIFLTYSLFIFTVIMTYYMFVDTRWLVEKDYCV